MNRANIVPRVPVQVRRQLLRLEEQREQAQSWRDQLAVPPSPEAVMMQMAMEGLDDQDVSFLYLSDEEWDDPLDCLDGDKSYDDGYLGDLSEPLVDESTSLDLLHRRIFLRY